VQGQKLELRVPISDRTFSPKVTELGPARRMVWRDALRPWLFRIAHNAAIDLLRSRGRQQTELSAEIAEIAAYDDAPDLLVVRAALARFLAKGQLILTTH